MKLNSARLAWHDCYYTPGDSLAAFVIERARLGSAVQLSEFDGRTARAVHQAIAGRIQQAINTLPPYVAAFGHWMYNPLADDDSGDYHELAEAAGRHLKRVLLELGGHNPLLVLDDADLDYAVDASAFGAYLHQGVAGCSLESPQTCANVRAREWGRRGEVGEELVPPSG